MKTVSDKVVRHSLA